MSGVTWFCKVSCDIQPGLYSQRGNRANRRRVDLELGRNDAGKMGTTSVGSDDRCGCCRNGHVSQTVSRPAMPYQVPLPNEEMNRYSIFSGRVISLDYNRVMTWIEH